MPKPRTQFINDYARAAAELEVVRSAMCSGYDEDLVLAAEAMESVTHAYAIRAMRRSNGSMRGRLEALAMVAIQSADSNSGRELILIT